MDLLDPPIDPEEPAVVELAKRVANADALAQAGDPRLRLPHQEDYWVTVPAGSFIMGAQRKNRQRPDYDPDASDIEDFGGERVQVRGFQIGRFPVTVFEYQEYLIREGCEPGWTMRWERQVSYPSRPVVGIGRNAARRYCLWAQGRLPTEREWEFAARGPGDKPRRYPWGNEPPDASRANYTRSWGQGATPVGLFPAGATPAAQNHDRIQDMAGNVWEWVEGDCWLRGGSFAYGARCLRASCRYGSLCYMYTNVGFRCVRDLPEGRD